MTRIAGITADNIIQNRLWIQPRHVHHVIIVIIFGQTLVVFATSTNLNLTVEKLIIHAVNRVVVTLMTLWKYIRTWEIEMTFDKIRMILAAILILAGAAFNYSYCAERMPLQTYYAFTNSSTTVYLIRHDYGTGIETITDSVESTNPMFSHDIDWDMYDPIHRRIFFQEALTDVIIRTHVYELDTHGYFDLPFDNYMGQHVDMVVSPRSRYIIFTYMSEPLDTIWSPDDYETVVLDGENLNEISERVGLSITESFFHLLGSIVTADNRYLINPEYLPVSDTSKEHGYVIYSLPGLIPLDTLFHNRLLWNNNKSIWDFSQDGLLFVASKADSTRNLPPGTYAFIFNISQRRVSSRFVPIAPAGISAAKLTPEGDEIVVVYSDSGKVRRYSLSNGRLKGETDVPQGSGFNFFGGDGNLYLHSSDYNTYIVVDYRHNRILRTFNFERR
jgi:hypothetical protein